MGVYAGGLRGARPRPLRPRRRVVDVQNGLPFFTRLATRAPVIVLVHHVHREQWPVVYPGLVGRVGWVIEHRVAPRLYRGCQYVAVSPRHARRAGRPGRRPPTASPSSTTAPTRCRRVGAGKTAHPSSCVVGRLVPHKQVEHAIDAAQELRGQHPDLRLHVVGCGWWEHELTDYADGRAAGLAGRRRLRGARERGAQARGLRRSVGAWRSPRSRRAGDSWSARPGCTARRPSRTRSAGGTRESIAHGVSGLLVDDPAEFTAPLRRVLADA